MINTKDVPIYLIVILSLFILFNQYQIVNIDAFINVEGSSFIKTTLRSSQQDLSSINISELKSTAHSVAALFPVEDIETIEDTINVMIPTGTPDYGNYLGVSFDDVANSLDFMAKELYPQIKSEIKNNYPEIWQRYLNLATKPVGISCEFCCGVGPIGIDQTGNLKCGCQHNVAAHALSLWLMKNTDYSDAEIVKEVLKWKTLWFPKKMVELSFSMAGKDISSIDDLPEMVGGC